MIMSNLDKVILGINHQFIYPESITNGDAHTENLRKLASNPYVDALDCWVWASHSKEELAILRDSGKVINYNIGDRVGEVPVLPHTADAKERTYAFEILKRETEFALESGAKKIIFASGKDVAPEERADARKRLEEFILEWSQMLPKDVWLTIEPTDRDVDKFFLLGDAEETCQVVRNIRKDGFERMGILLDMGHVPIMHETLESASVKMGELLEHIHLGNCIIKNQANQLYGDKHPCWGAVDGEYDEKDGEVFLNCLKDVGYFTRGHAQTVSFEMRPLTGMSSEQTIEYLVKWFERTYASLK